MTLFWKVIAGSQYLLSASFRHHVTERWVRLSTLCVAIASVFETEASWRWLARTGDRDRRIHPQSANRGIPISLERIGEFSGFWRFQHVPASRPRNHLHTFPHLQPRDAKRFNWMAEELAGLSLRHGPTWLVATGEVKSRG